MEEEEEEGEEEEEEEEWNRKQSFGSALIHLPAHSHLTPLS